MILKGSVCGKLTQGRNMVEKPDRETHLMAAGRGRYRHRQGKDQARTHLLGHALTHLPNQILLSAAQPAMNWWGIPPLQSLPSEHRSLWGFLRSNCNTSKSLKRELMAASLA